MSTDRFRRRTIIIYRQAGLTIWWRITNQSLIRIIGFNNFLLKSNCTIMSMLKNFRNRLKGRRIGDEFEQSLIRLFACMLMLAYVYYLYRNNQVSIHIVDLYFMTIPISLVFLAWSLFEPTHNWKRICLIMKISKYFKIWYESLEI